MTSDCLPIASRRTFLQNAAIAATAALVSLGLTKIVFAQEIPYAAQIRADGRSATITTKPLRRNVSVLMGAGGNIVVLPGPDGKVLVDAGSRDKCRLVQGPVGWREIDHPDLARQVDGEN